MGYLNVPLPLKDEVDGHRVFKHRICNDVGRLLMINPLLMKIKEALVLYCFSAGASFNWMACNFELSKKTNCQMDQILQDRSRAYVTSPNFRLNYFFLR